ncbi:hypothetical protein OPT61_g1407 [Boeremia exigua]|uniref:Uncharacterized protein n=1 Tax=Boeremia exigua TaxID=749465 RepID=A0ACC2IQD9_9PLEO|nr:hypothetical protein OPT61_g1407 [Boeremia exigua]
MQVRLPGLSEKRSLAVVAGEQRPRGLGEQLVVSSERNPRRTASVVTRRRAAPARRSQVRHKAQQRPGVFRP